MSWKSLVTAGLLCVLASPAFAAPTVTVTKGGTFANGNLDVNGNWVWTVAITPDQTLVTGGTGTPLAAELGYASNRAVISVANATPAVFDTNNPGTQIFTWETLYGTPAKPEGIEVDCTGCTVTNTAASGGHAGTVVAGALNQIFAALRRANTTSTNAQNMLTVTVAGPTNTNNNTTLTESGAYGGKGRVAQISGTNGANFDTFSGAFSRTVHAADANMDGNVDGLDLSALAANFGGSGKHWYQADYNGDGNVDGLDLSSLASNFGFTGPPPGAGAGLGAGGAVPEPASIALVGLAVLGSMGMIRRKR